MKKIFYALLGAACALIVKSVLESRSRALYEGVTPRRLSVAFNGDLSTAEDEVAGPLLEV